MPTLYRAFRYKLAPTADQRSLMRRLAGVTRLVYNLALEQRRDWWRHYRRETGKPLNYVAQARELTALRAEYDWIAAVHVTPQQQALRDLEKAYANFLAGRAGYPSPRRKGVNDAFRFQGREKNQASFVCATCGHRDHADINAAKVILRRNTASMLVEEGHRVSGKAGTIGEALRQAGNLRPSGRGRC